MEQCTQQTRDSFEILLNKVKSGEKSHLLTFNPQFYYQHALERLKDESIEENPLKFKIILKRNKGVFSFGRFINEHADLNLVECGFTEEEARRQA